MATRKFLPGSIGELYGGEPAFVEAMTPARALYNEAIYKYADCPAQMAIQEADLVSEVKVNAAGISEFVWVVKTNENNPGQVAPRSTEVRLNTRDAFIFDRIGLYFGNELTAGTTPGTTVYHQFPNNAAISLVAGGGLGLNFPSVIEAYNGHLAMTANSVTFIRSMHAARFIYADQAQAGTLLFTASLQAWSNQEADRGFARLTPALDIKGSDTVQFTLKLPEPSSFALQASNSVVARLVLRGLLLQGGAETVQN